MKHNFNITSLVIISLIFLILSLAPILSSVIVLEPRITHQQQHNLEIAENGEFLTTDTASTQ